MANTKTLNKIVVVGRDAAAWLSAVVLKNALTPFGVTIEVVELPSLLTDVDAYMSLPPLEGLHRILAIDEWDLLRKTNGVFSLGSTYTNFQKGGGDYFCPFGGHGKQIGDVPFLDHWVRAKSRGLVVEFERFSLNSSAARALKFFKPDSHTETLHVCDYGYHLNAKNYVNHLKQLAVNLGVQLNQSSSLSVKQDASTGDIESVLLDLDRVVEGDFFIDATGEDSFLLGKVLGVPLASWKAHFPFTRRLSMHGMKLDQLPAYSKILANKNGVGHSLALQNYTAFSFAYDPVRTESDLALQTALVMSNSKVENSVSFLDSNPGFRTPWKANVVAVGSASVVLDPAVNLELHLIHLGLMHFLSALPINSPIETSRTQFNQLIIGVVEDCRDFAFAKYKLNRVFDGGAWESLNGVLSSKELKTKMERFVAGKQFEIGENATFGKNDWTSLFIGSGLLPVKFDPRINEMDEKAVMNEFKEILKSIELSVEEMGSLNAYFDDL